VVRRRQVAAADLRDLSFERVAEALGDLAARRVKGKVVLVP